MEDNKWLELTNKEIDSIEDKKIRSYYRKKVKECYRHIISILYTRIKNKNSFKFSQQEDNMTCSGMLKDLFSYYYSKGLDKDEVINLIVEQDYKKRY